MSALGIGELARRAGVEQQVIRAWESRFGFPEPRRTSGGRRVYDTADVDRVIRVLALKDSGLRLAQAIDRVRQQGVEGNRLSVYAELRRVHPHLQHRVLRRDALTAVSHAIEDEALARAVRPVVYGAFQREEFYRRSAPRWNELARTATSCVVLADFASVSGGAGRPVEIGLREGSPLLREWAVVVGSLDFSAVLTGWEMPGEHAVPRGQQRFETVFSFDPAAVRTAMDVCVAAARDSGSGDRLSELALGELALGDLALGDPATPSVGVDAFVARAFDYLQQS
ncbi:MAG: DICT sensory domain-containing protein [Nocardioides sp.]